MRTLKISLIYILIANLFLSCTYTDRVESDIEKEPKEIISDVSEIDNIHSLDDWIVRIPFSFSYQAKVEAKKITYRLHGSHFGKNYIYQTVQVEPGNYYLAALNLLKYKGRSKNFGLYIYEDDKEIGYHVLDVRKTESRNLLSVKFKAKSDEVTIRLGFRRIGKGEAVFIDPVLQEVGEFPEDYMSTYAKYLADKLNLNDFDSLNYHDNVLKIAKYVNSILISPIRNSNEISNPAERDKYLKQKNMEREAIKNEINELLPGSYFAEYTGLTLSESSNCQKSSLSSKNILDEFNIPTTQVHFVNDDNIGIHQFFEYWHPYLDRWIIVDPFYGVNYINSNEELIGFIELSELAKSKSISLKNVVNLEIEYAYFVPEILESELKMQFENHILGDMRKSYSH